MGNFTAYFIYIFNTFQEIRALDATMSIDRELTISGCIMKKHWVTHCRAIRIRNTKVTVRRRRVIWFSAFFAFSCPWMLFRLDMPLLALTTREMINMFRIKMVSQGTRTRNIQCTQNSQRLLPSVIPNSVRSKAAPSGARSEAGMGQQVLKWGVLMRKHRNAMIPIPTTALLLLHISCK